MKESNQIYICRIIFLILSIMVATIIFMFSSQNGDESKTTSRGFTRKIVDIVPFTKNLEEEQKQQIVENVQPVIRKMAHFSIYTILGICLFNFFRTFKWIRKKQIILTVGTGAIYTISDEIHQFFSDGRAPLIKDVFIDTAGCLFGVGIMLLVIKLVKKGKKNMKKSIEKNVDK